MTSEYTRKKIVSEYKSLCRKWKKIPTVIDLRSNGYNQLEQAINKKFGKLTNLRKAANILVDINPHGYWTEARIVSELQKFCKTNKKAVQQEAIGSLLIRKGKKKLYSAVSELDRKSVV